MSKTIEAKLNNDSVKLLCQTLARLDKPQAVRDFLRDLLTLEEFDEVARRFEVAKLLDKEKKFREIAKQTKMSSATIARINYWLHHGTGGYRLALKALARG